MKDTKGNIITEEEFVKDIGHNVVGDMKEQWKEQLEKLGQEIYWDFDDATGSKGKLFNFITNLLAEQRKELITQIPDDLKTFVRMSIDNNWQFTEEQVIKAEVAWNKLMERKLIEQRKDLFNQILSEAPEGKDWKETGSYGFNQANAQWREIINKLK